MTMSKLLSTQEVLDKTGLHGYQRLHTECVRRNIKPIKRGAHHYYTENDVKALMAPPLYMGAKDIATLLGVPYSAVVATLAKSEIDTVVVGHHINYRVEQARKLDYAKVDSYKDGAKAELAKITRISEGEKTITAVGPIAAIVDRTPEEVIKCLDAWGVPRKGYGTLLYYDTSVLERFYEAGYPHLSGEDYMPRDDAMKALGMKQYRWMAEVQLGGIHVLVINKYAFVKREEIEHIKTHKTVFESVTQIAKDYNLDVKLFHRVVDESGIEKHRHKKIYYYKRDDLMRCMEVYSAEIARKDQEKNVIKAFLKPIAGQTANEFLTEACFPYFEVQYGKKCPDTLSHIKRYLGQRTARVASKDVVGRIRTIAKCLECIPQTITKELAEYTDVEIDALLAQIETESATREAVYFINYLHDKTDCKYHFDRTFAPSAPQSFEAYTKEEWKEFLEMVVDIERHIPRAKESYRYAQIWLLMLLHAFLPWRARDFCSIPIPFEVVADEMTMGQAVLIMDDIERKMKGRKTQKTDKQLFFTAPPIALMIPVASAIVICDKHRRENDAKTLIIAEVARRYNRKPEFTEFGFPFSSMRANKTVQTSVYRTASVWPGHVAVLYKLASRARSHVTNISGISAVTAVYIDLLPQTAGGFSDELCEAICRRGLFGFMYEELLMMLAGQDTSQISFLERTELIEQIQRTMPIQKADEIAGYLMASIDGKREKTIATWENIEAVKNRIAEGLELSGNGKATGIICTCVDGCCEKMAKDCTECPFALLPVHEILKVNRKMHSMLENLSDIKGETEADQNLKKKYMGQLTYYMQLANRWKKQFGQRDDVMSILYADGLKEKLLLLKG